MGHLPPVSSRRLVRVLEKAGFVIERQVGSHIKLRSEERNSSTMVAMHDKEIPRGFLKSILKQANLSEEEFRKLL